MRCRPVAPRAGEEKRDVPTGEDACAPPAHPRPGSRGFSLIELLISLAVLALALALAAQLLVEAAQMLADAAAEQRDLPAPVALARVRADVRAATAFAVLPAEPGEDARLLLAGLPAGDVIYAREGDELVRRVVEPGGKVGEPAPLLNRVTGFHPFRLGPRLVRLDVSYLAHVPRRTPLAVLPGLAGPTARERQETLMLAPRGAGLGKAW